VPSLQSEAFWVIFFGVACILAGSFAGIDSWVLNEHDVSQLLELNLKMAQAFLIHI